MSVFHYKRAVISVVRMIVLSLELIGQAAEGVGRAIFAFFMFNLQILDYVSDLAFIRQSVYFSPCRFSS